VDTNFAVGTILGIWPGDKLTGITGREQVQPAAGYELVCLLPPAASMAACLQVCSMMGVYGPRTVLVIAFKEIPGTHDFLLMARGAAAGMLGRQAPAALMHMGPTFLSCRMTASGCM
jgi:sedoheptulose-bisphosphatase